MKKLRRTLSATALVIVLVGFLSCALVNSFGSGFNSLSDIRFISVSLLIGLSEGEVIKKIGKPKLSEKEACWVDFPPALLEGTRITGTAWTYEQSDTNFFMSLDVCLFKGYVISQRRYYNIRVGQLMTEGIESSVDFEFAYKLMLNGSDEDPKDKEKPPLKGKGFEI